MTQHPTIQLKGGQRLEWRKDGDTRGTRHWCITLELRGCAAVPLE